eukprot:g44105.t1
MASPPGGQRRWWMQTLTATGGGIGSENRDILLTFSDGGSSGAPPATSGSKGQCKVVALARRHLGGGWPEWEPWRDGGSGLVWQRSQGLLVVVGAERRLLAWASCGSSRAGDSWLWGKCRFDMGPSIGSCVGEVSPATKRWHLKNGDSYIGWSGAGGSEAVEKEWQHMCD